MEKFLTELERQISVRYQTDVLVAGGGPSGLAAAVGAARQGKRVLLVEKNAYLGGMSIVAGAICGLYTSSVNRPLQQLTEGFAGEFYKRLQQCGGVAAPQPFGQTAIVVHDPIRWKETADALIEAHGIQLLLHTQVVGVQVEDRQVCGVIVENAQGRQAIYALRYIDATGDGALSAAAGVPFTKGRNGEVQYATATFRMAGVDWKRVDVLSTEQVQQLVRQAEKETGMTLPRKHIYLLRAPHEGEVLCNATAVLGPEGKAIDATDAEQLTFGELAGRKQARIYEAFLKRYIPGFENSYMSSEPGALGIRQSRTIECVVRLTNQDVISARKRADSVAKSAWCIEAHGANGVFLHYIQDDYYDIPYGTLVPVNLDNLTVCGRLLCAEHEALASARVSAQCLLTGYAAGTASSLSMETGCAMKDVDVERLQTLIQYEYGDK